MEITKFCQVKQNSANIFITLISIVCFYAIKYLEVIPYKQKIYKETPAVKKWNN